MESGRTKTGVQVNSRSAQPCTTLHTAQAPSLFDDAEIDALFSAPQRQEPPPEKPVKLRWRGCVVCGSKDTLPAHPAHDVCLTCTTDPSAARARLEVQRSALVSQQHSAARLALATLDALDPAERERWDRFAELRVLFDAGQAGPDDARRCEATHRAYRSDDPRVSKALRDAYTADECLFWANQADEHGQRAIDIRLAQLAVCLEEPTP
jgi:hypothetical protein